MRPEDYPEATFTADYTFADFLRKDVDAYNPFIAGIEELLPTRFHFRNGWLLTPALVAIVAVLVLLKRVR